ncbi:hypothetical protein ZIOFF_044436 [Zingiber officinale]|uniref:Delta(14)-sterol reductase n=1 Tax=Zingiber officinale TaxID=94328 RepID=A0A8J5KR79_ZINOF|nr:hypothetical protein ZIOFF_044436 [Zingiber officinale]
MEVEAILSALIPSWSSVILLFCYFGYLAVAGSVLPGKIVPGAVLSDGSRLHYRCNGSGRIKKSIQFMPDFWKALVRSSHRYPLAVQMAGMVSGPTNGNQAVITFAFTDTFTNWCLYEVDAPYGTFLQLTVIADKGFELLSTTFILSLIVSVLSLGVVLCYVHLLTLFQVSLILYATGLKSKNQSSSLRPHVTGDFVHDWWFGVQLNPHFFGIDLKFFFVRAGMMGWLLINLSLLAKSYEAGTTNVSVILYQLFCTLYVLDYFFYKEFMTSTLEWLEKGWWLLKSKVELTKAAIVANCLGDGETNVAQVCIDYSEVSCSYMIFRGANTQKHVFKKDPKAPIWGKPPNVVGGKLLASGYWGIARHCNYLGDLLLALSFSLLCGASSAIPYFYPTYLLILLIWRERRDEARCSQKYKEIWVE